MAKEIEKIKQAIETLESIGETAQAEAMRKKLAAMLQTANPVATEPVPAITSEQRQPSIILEGDIEAFKRGGIKYWMPSLEGTFRSRLVEIFMPEFTKKPQYWFVFETNDPKLEKQGRGAIQCETSKGFFKAKDILDGIGAEYEIDESAGKVKIYSSLPIDCWATWSYDKDATGGVGIDDKTLRPAKADVQQAI